jgi:hypothetical protein
MNDEMKTYKTVELAPLGREFPTEIYVFGADYEAAPVGFRDGRHARYPWMWSVSLREGHHMFERLRGRMISRIVVTSAATRYVYDYPSARQVLDRLRAEHQLLLRVPPALYMEF